MKEVAFDVPGLKAIRETCDRVNLDAGSRLIVLTAPLPECVMASVLLSTAMQRTRGTFHIMYGEPICPAKRIEQILEEHAKSRLALVGVIPDEELEVTDQVFALGSGNSYSNSVGVGEEGEEPLAAYVLASEKLSVGRKELKLALAGSIAANPEVGPVREILEYCKERQIVNTRKGFLLFGSNFLSLIETLEYSTFPYLSRLSGNRSACERLLEESDIPLTKRGAPVLNLTKTEQQNLNSNLIPMLDSETISKVLGQDFEFVDEKSNSPMRFLSNMMVLAQIAWIKSKHGLAAATYFGDRAQQLRTLIDDSLELSKQSLDAVPKMMAAINELPDIDEKQMLEFQVNVGTDVLPILGKIGLQSGLFDSDFLILGNQRETQLAWDKGKHNLRTVMRELCNAGLQSISTSYASLRIDGVMEDSGDTIRKALSSVMSGGAEEN
ncbi:hypothetical protein EU519_00500 [Candidatus Thorarchaeota archaeon]|nr:MAG: hypothetical protein EU519_00500 [Candidatus Thorarchaeota archaeon]